MTRFDWWQSRSIGEIQAEAAARPRVKARIPHVGEDLFSGIDRSTAPPLTEKSLKELQESLFNSWSYPPETYYVSQAGYSQMEERMHARAKTELKKTEKQKKRDKRKDKKAKRKEALRNKINASQPGGFTGTVYPYAKADAEITAKLHATFVGSPLNEPIDILVVADPILRPDTAFLINNNETVLIKNIGIKK